MLATYNRPTDERYVTSSGVATIFGPPQTTCLGLWPRGYGDYFFLAALWRAPSTSRAPHGRGVCGALATPLVTRGSGQCDT